MRELFVARRQACDEAGQTHEYSYAIQIGELMTSGDFACESYGPKIWEEGGEACAVPNVTVRISRIDELMDLLVRNVVTPASLEDVLADWL